MTISTIQALVTALKLARPGDELELAPGAYDRLGLSQVKIPAPGVVIAGDGVTIAGVELTNCEGIAFRGLEVTINARTQTAFNVVGSGRIRLVGLDMHGAPGSTLAGLLFRTSTNVSVEDSDFHDLGGAVRNIDSLAVTVKGCRFKELRGDGIQSTGSSQVTIDGNHFTDFHTKPGDHPDAIQFFTLNQKASVQDIVITDNVVERGAGDIVQGIFLGNEAKLPYVNVLISCNALSGCMWNGVAVDLGQNVTVTDNLVQAFEDAEKVGSWIILSNCTDALLQGNWSTSYVKKGTQVRLVEKDNITIAPAVGGKTLLASWTSEQANDNADDLIAAAEARAGALQIQLDTTMADLGAARSEAKAARATLALVAADRDEDRAAMEEAQAAITRALGTFASAA